MCRRLSRKSGSLNLLKPLRSVQARIRILLPLPLPLPRGAEINSVTLLVIAALKNKKLQCYSLTTLIRGRQSAGKKKQIHLNK
jgi:hypothetical protein